MKKVTATEASKAFGQLVDDVQSGSVREAHLDALIQEGITAADEGDIRPLTRKVRDDTLASARQRYEERSQ